MPQTARNVNAALEAGDVNVPVAADKAGRIFVNPSSPGDLFRLFVPAAAAGANKVFLDLFNASDKVIALLSAVPVISGAVAVTGTLAVDLFLTRTTAVGTGGVAAVADNTALTVTPAITRFDNAGAALASGITARSAPSGGATAGAVLSFNSYFTEETNASSYVPKDLVTQGNNNAPFVLVNPGSGIRIVQGAVASVGNIGFDLIFGVRKP